jgi:hypothetical protein
VSSQLLLVRFLQLKAKCGSVLMAGSTVLKNRGGFGGKSQSIISLVFGSSEISCLNFYFFSLANEAASQGPYAVNKASMWVRGENFGALKNFC